MSLEDRDLTYSITIMKETIAGEDKSTRIDRIVHLLVTEALDLEQKTRADFVGALYNVQMLVSAKVIKIMEAKRAEERLHADATLKKKVKKEKKNA